MVGSPRLIVGASAVLLAIALFPSGLTANHRWGRYHWARASNPLVLEIGDNVSSNWQSFLTAAESDWDQPVGPYADVFSLSVASGQSDSSCSPTLGRIEVCNGAYGDNNWLGIAQIWTGSRSHIVAATTRVNDTYFDDPDLGYDTPSWRRFVMCQEIGHDFGLDHQDVDFYNTNLGTCMDYTADPDGSVLGPLSNLSPNEHDFEELASIYSHLDGGGGGGGGGGRGRGGLPSVFPDLPDPALVHVPVDSPGQWGRLVRSSGRLALYERDLGNGQIVFTFVIWA